MKSVQGYIRSDGKVGFRNHLLIMSLTGCLSQLAERIADQIDGAVSVPHTIGCGQYGPDMDLLALQLECFAKHPNVGGTLFLHMSCEGMRPYNIPDKVAATGKLVEELNFHKIGGTTATIHQGVETAEKMQKKMASMTREPVPLSSLIVGTKCGSSDNNSYRYANPALGMACDQLVDEGGTVVLSEAEEMLGAVDDLAERAVSPEVAQEIRNIISRMKQNARALGHDYDAEIANAPDRNEHRRAVSLQRTAKAGTRPIQNVFRLGEQIAGPGLVVLDAPNNDNDSVSGLAASGCQLIAFTTGMGTPMGCALAPVVKIASNYNTYQRMQENIDVNAGPQPDELYDMEDAAQRIYQVLVECANGKLCQAEKLGHTEISLSRYGMDF